MNIFTYKWWWSRFGGRPWTFILRDVWHKFEIVPQLWWLMKGAIIYKYFGWAGIGVFIAIYLYGYLQGHLKWGKPYQEGQGKENQQG